MISSVLLEDMETKNCLGCGQRPTIEFGKDPRCVDGLKSRCTKCSSEYVKQIRSENPKYAKKAEDWRIRNAGKLRQRGYEYRLAIRMEVIRHYSKGSMECECCQESIVEFLTIDHVDGGGSNHRREIKINMYHWLKKNGFPTGYRILCYNCNMAIGVHGICPHFQ